MKYLVNKKSRKGVDNLIIIVNADDFMFEENMIIFYNFGVLLEPKKYVSMIRKEDVISIIGECKNEENNLR